jgi:hypothetical protein
MFPIQIIRKNKKCVTQDKCGPERLSKQADVGYEFEMAL